MWDIRLDESKTGMKITRKNISNLRYADDTTIMVESEEPLDEGERGRWKSWLKFQYSKNKDHGISPITSLQIEGEKVAWVTDFLFLDSKITEDGDCSL